MKENVLIESINNRLFTDTKAAGHHGKGKILIRFQHRLEKRTNHVSHLFIKTMKIRIFQRYIILINQYKNFFSCTPMQAVRQKTQSIRIICFLSPQITDAKIMLFFCLGQFPALLDFFPVSGIFLTQNFLEHGKRKRTGRLFHGL